MDPAQPEVKKVSPEDLRESRRAVALLATGAALGLLAAAWALIAPSGDANLPDDAVAVVNGVVIREDDYLRLLAGFQSDSRSPINDDVRQHILDRMIEEELLVQRGLALGLARADRRVRGDLTSSLIASIVATAEEGEPQADELATFYENNLSFFARPGRLRVEQIFFRTPVGSDPAQTLARAGSARMALNSGETFEDVRVQWGEEEISPIPDTLLPALKLREYIGPTALAAAEGLEVDEISEPILAGGGVRLIRMIERSDREQPALDTIRQQVENEWRRRAGDRALRAYLDQLREEVDVQVLVDFQNEEDPVKQRS